MPLGSSIDLTQMKKELMILKTGKQELPKLKHKQNEEFNTQTHTHRG